MEKSTPKQPTNRLRLLREQSGLSQPQLADKIGIPQPDVSAFETGRRVGPKNTLKLSRFFNVDARYLLGEIDQP